MPLPLFFYLLQVADVLVIPQLVDRILPRHKAERQAAEKAEREEAENAKREEIAKVGAEKKCFIYLETTRDDVA